MSSEILGTGRFFFRANVPHYHPISPADSPSIPLFLLFTSSQHNALFLKIRSDLVWQSSELIIPGKSECYSVECRICWQRPGPSPSSDLYKCGTLCKSTPWTSVSPSVKQAKSYQLCVLVGPPSFSRNRDSDHIRLSRNGLWLTY